jgi:uncharacterized protein with NRDE domain
MGCTKGGRLAFLTNVLEPDAMPGARTRGDLPLRFLQVCSKPYQIFLPDHPNSLGVFFQIVW